MTEQLPGFGVTPEELDATAERLRTERGAGVDRRICVCGHAMSKHGASGERVWCSPTRMTCPCKHPREVIIVSDTRPFLRKTKGPGVEHALMMGLQGLISKGRTWEWVEGFPMCEGWCARSDVSVLPVAVSRREMVSWEPEEENMLVCNDCMKRMLPGGGAALVDVR